MTEPVRERDKTLGVILAIIGVAVVIALAVVFLRGAPETLDPATPEGVVQAYSVAVLDQDRPTALSHLIPELAKDCSTADAHLDGLRLTVVSSTIRASSATVRVTVTTNSGAGPLENSEYASDDSFTLQKVGDVWLIETTPWQLAICYPKGG
ncbi:MAG: hypothetical protein ABIW81_01220 [Terrimesophilobacter sp.]